MAITTIDLDTLASVHHLLDELHEDLKVRGAWQRMWQIGDERAHIEILRDRWTSGLQEEQLPLAM